MDSLIVGYTLQNKLPLDCTIVSPPLTYFRFQTDFHFCDGDGDCGHSKLSSPLGMAVRNTGKVYILWFNSDTDVEAYTWLGFSASVRFGADGPAETKPYWFVPCDANGNTDLKDVLPKWALVGKHSLPYLDDTHLINCTSTVNETGVCRLALTWTGFPDGEKLAGTLVFEPYNFDESKRDESGYAPCPVRVYWERPDGSTTLEDDNNNFMDTYDLCVSEYKEPEEPSLIV